MKRWVITVTILDASIKSEVETTKVIALISARKGIDYIKKYVENMYHILVLDLKSQEAVTDYNKPDISIQGKTYVNRYDISLFRKPFYIRGQYSEILDVRNGEHGASWLQWKGMSYKRHGIDPETYEPVELEEVVPAIMEAPQADFLSNLFK